MPGEPALRTRTTYAEYLAFEQTAPLKHEFIDGIVYAMAGGTQNHALVISAVTAALVSRLRGTRCRPRTTEGRVYFPTGEAAYPDVSVVCGKTESPEADPDAITNPSLVIEVLSPSTEAYDRGEKFRRYESLSSLQEYALVGVEREFVEVWTRNPDDTWTRRVWLPGQEVPFALGIRVPVDEIYELKRAEAAASAEPA